MCKTKSFIILTFRTYYTPPPPPPPPQPQPTLNEIEGGYTGFTSFVCPSDFEQIRVRSVTVFKQLQNAGIIDTFLSVIRVYVLNYQMKMHLLQRATF